MELRKPLKNGGKHAFGKMTFRWVVLKASKLFYGVGDVDCEITRDGENFLVHWPC